MRQNLLIRKNTSDFIGSEEHRQNSDEMTDLQPKYYHFHAMCKPLALIILKYIFSMRVFSHRLSS